LLTIIIIEYHVIIVTVLKVLKVRNIKKFCKERTRIGVLRVSLAVEILAFPFLMEMRFLRKASIIKFSIVLMWHLNVEAVSL